tara:strand:- start:62 stop:328 length:267 start_codon:yes stop_codon:yes gene_type:complete
MGDEVMPKAYVNNILVDVTDAQVAEGLYVPPATAAQVRQERDILLAETDWCANSDVIMSDDMTTYRQALRDITGQDGFPENITWPTKP